MLGWNKKTHQEVRKKNPLLEYLSLRAKKRAPRRRIRAEAGLVLHPQDHANFGRQGAANVRES